MGTGELIKKTRANIQSTSIQPWLGRGNSHIKRMWVLILPLGVKLCDLVSLRVVESEMMSLLELSLNLQSRGGKNYG